MGRPHSSLDSFRVSRDTFSRVAMHLSHHCQKRMCQKKGCLITFRKGCVPLLPALMLFSAAPCDIGQGISCLIPTCFNSAWIPSLGWGGGGEPLFKYYNKSIQLHKMGGKTAHPCSMSFGRGWFAHFHCRAGSLATTSLPILSLYSSRCSSSFCPGFSCTSAYASRHCLSGGTAPATSERL